MEAKIYNETSTITFGDMAENHKGMQMIGEKAESGFLFDDLKKARKWFMNKNIRVEIYRINDAIPKNIIEEIPEAYILVARNGLSAIVDTDAFHEEQMLLEKDKKALMYGRVVEKKARHNLCFSDISQDANYENGRGTIISFSEDRVKFLNKVRETLPDIIGEKGSKLQGEGNYYYSKQCGIGFHGDAERYKVIAIRTGDSMPLHYQWFYKSKPIGRRFVLSLGHGDVYIMSEKAVGNDWKKKNIYTVRHAAGANKFLSIK